MPKVFNSCGDGIRLTSRLKAASFGGKKSLTLREQVLIELSNSTFRVGVNKTFSQLLKLISPGTGLLDTLLKAS